jgi:hypothetical protein
MRSYHRFQRRLLARLNRLFEPKFASWQMKASPTPDMVLTVYAEGALPIPLKSMGSGIAQMVMLLALLEEDAERSARGCHYYLEEPELHLHPRLLLRPMAQLPEYDGAQFFLTSHSSVVLDAAASRGDRVFLFSQGAAGDCTAAPCDGVVEQHAALDALGVSGSALLQANCAVWVEGPSDRLYLRRWLQEAAAEGGESLLEGADYAFVFYGGRVLSHFGFDAEDAGLADLVPMLAVSRFSAVVMDRDLSGDRPLDELREAKRAILRAAEADPVHRLACVSASREVENDLPLTLLRAAMEARLGLPESTLGGLELTGEKRYPDEAVSFLSLDEGKARTARRKLEDKVALAAAVLGAGDRAGRRLEPRPDYVGRLYDFIRASRGA